MANPATAEIVNALEAASLLLNEESKGLRASFSRGGIALCAVANTRGEADVKLACKFEGQDLEIGINPRFLLDGLKCADTDDVQLELSAANRPIKMTAGPNYTVVVMPVNLSN